MNAEAKVVNGAGGAAVPEPSAAPVAVALFAACYNVLLWPETPKAVVRLLERLGCVVHFPLEQTCCGQMFTNSGYSAEALPLVRKFIDVFEPYDAVVVPSGSCVGSIRHQRVSAAERSGDDELTQRAASLVPPVYELTEFLVDVLGVTDVGAHPIAYAATPCASFAPDARTRGTRPDAPL